MKSVSGKKLCKILVKRGWILKRVNGSHHIFIKNKKIFRISVPVHADKDLKIGLLRHIMKIAEISDKDIN